MKSINTKSTPLGHTDTSTEASLKLTGSSSSAKNTVGYYKIGADGTIEGVEIVFENAQSAPAGTSLNLDLGGDGAQSLGIFIIADGYKANKSFQKIDLTQGDIDFIYHHGQSDERPATIYDNARDVSFIHSYAGKETVIKGQIYHGGGDSLNSDGKDHTQITREENDTTETIKIGFEDSKGLGDKDFDDVTLEITITKPDVNDAPVARDDIFNGHEDVVITGNVLNDNTAGADSDADGDTLSVTPANVTTANGGTVVLLADGSFTYTPAENFYGTDSFEYTLSDPDGAISIATVTLNVAAVNDGPAAQDDEITGHADNIVTGNVLADNGHGVDTDIEGDALSVEPKTFVTANGGTVTLLANGDFTYIPAPGYTGPDSFTYTALDGQGGTGSATVNLTILTNIIVSSIGDSMIDTTALNDIIYAQDGNDTINSGAGNDIIYGGGGADTIFADDDDDIVYGGDKNDHLNGGNGNDTLYGDEGNDILHGDDGNDTLHGGIGNDYLYGDAGDDTLHGDDGIDYLYGNDGNDTIYGGNGDDSIYGGLGDDLIYGDAGNDIITGNEGHDTIYGGDGDDKIYGEDGNDTIYGDAGIDTLYGGLGDDILNGGDGDDILSGDAGNDTLYGDAGKDTIFAGDGDDIIYGGAGEDTLWGQLGADTFKFTVEDMDGTINRIRDFKTAQGDVLDITDILIGYEEGVSDINDFIRFDAPASKGDISVAVDRDGAGDAYSMSYIAKLSNPGEVLDAQTLLDNGNLIA
ncbi:MAG: tandem-95 repeat protein [Alphaproteobacteria bacterium]|nr:tandem-95 repeat protein [Alphaproteobacteria bacterium]